MREEDISRIEAWFDGEASPEEIRLVEQMLEADPEARSFLHNLQRTRELLKSAHPESSAPPLSWEQLSRAEASRSKVGSRRLLSFPRVITAFAAILVLGAALWFPLRHAGTGPTLQVTLGSAVELVETDLEDATPVVYLDQPSGWTVVWVVEDGSETGI